MGYYKELVKNKIQFNFKDLFSKSKWSLVEQRYPMHLELLRKFRIHIINTGALFISSILFVIFLIIMFRFL